MSLVMAGLLRGAATFALIASVLFWLAPSAQAAEPWSDKAMPVPEGLELWLDASREAAARQAAGLKEVASGGQMDLWHDASGKRRHLTQLVRDAQPRWIVDEPGTVVRFDGENDFFSVSGLDRSYSTLTLVVVGAIQSNNQSFSGICSANRAGQNDYRTGLNIDLGPFPSADFSYLNAEAAGFQGVYNFKQHPSRFGILHRLVYRVTDDGISVSLDDGESAQRRREAQGNDPPTSIAVDCFTVGARVYSNDAHTPAVSGFFAGDIAELLVWNRALSDAELDQIRGYVNHKYAALRAVYETTSRNAASLIERIENPPSVQMLVNGFTAKQLPVELTNINNVKYRSDGKLIALAYDGRIYLLSDKDGDSLEETVELFWGEESLRAPIGMALTPDGYKHGNGLFVASKGKCSLIVDTDGDDRADREIVVAEGWKEIGHGVDALGVAFGSDGSVYFGIGHENFANGYLLDEGQPRYRLSSERGTILRVAPDFSSREVVCTGIRFPVSMAFNAEGDLFATDQEGATWLPNGNPLDELLHIQQGRHYGFPPRHGRYLPEVRDEPSVFDYAPQHQSTCGLHFNEPVSAGGPVFGPPAWRGDALVCGYARGKLYRTQLVKTHTGYVARNHLIGCFNMLAADSCVSPHGDLVVAMHGGLPDWGSGPKGMGKLYKVFYSDRQAPQPVSVLAYSPNELRVAFDRPLDTTHLQNLSGNIKITGGKYVAPGDRFERLRPGYATVVQQVVEPRFELAVHGVSVTTDRRTLVVAVDTQSQAVPHVIQLPGWSQSLTESQPAADAMHPEMELGYQLHGVRAQWQSAGDADAKDRIQWTGVLPHIDMRVSHRFTARSADHDRLWELLAQEGTLSLECQLDLRNMLRPEVQPGSVVDDGLPPEQVTVVFRSDGPLEVRAGTGQVSDVSSGAGMHTVEWQLPPGVESLVPLSVRLETGSGSPNIAGGLPRMEVAFFTADDDRQRAMALRRVILPWATDASQVGSAPARVIPEQLSGGDWQRGRDRFFSSAAQCSKCHTVRGEGGAIGPDLSNLVHRDYDSVLRDIVHPSFAINPDYIPYAVELADGQVLTGTVRTEGSMLRIGKSDGTEIVVARDDVESLEPLTVSIMPEKLAEPLDEEGLRDLMTFLLLPDPQGE